MVNEARLVAHAIAVNHHAAIQVQAVVAAVREVLLHHAAPETCGQRRFQTVKGLSATSKLQDSLRILCYMTSEQVNAPELLLTDHLPQVLDDELP